MTVSFGMLGVVLMLDVCFVMNYLLVRALRQWTNVQRREEQQRSVSSSDKTKKKEDSSGNIFSDAVFAWVVGTVKLEPMSAKKFPGWKPIPYQFGIISTCVFVVLSCLLLSPELIVKHLGITTLGDFSGEFSTDLCVVEAFDLGMGTLRKDLLKQTNLFEAQKQAFVMSEFHDALVNDTSLYGVPPFACPSRGDVSGLKEDWNVSGSFFPNYCDEALEKALYVAQDRECYQEVCDCPTLPEGPIFQMIGMAGKDFCGAEVCIEVPHACPKHVADDLVSAAQEALDLKNVRMVQHEVADMRRANMTNNTRQFSTEDIPTNVYETVEKVTHQVNVASYIYIAYSCLALFFPSPLVLFRMPYWIAIKRLLFGVQKPYFICFVVALWWGVEYFSSVVWNSPEIRLFLNNLRSGDPCYVDADYLLQRQSILDDVCQQLLPLKPKFAASALTVTDVVTEIASFRDSCDCEFPGVSTEGMLKEYASQLSFVFNVSINGIEDLDFIGSSSENITFLGNSSICTNTTASRQLVWESHADNNSEAHWYDLWIASGFIATLLIKVAVANFGLALMELADPFVVCKGEFLWMPTSFGSGLAAAKTNTRMDSDERQMLESFDERGRALPPEMVQKWFKTKQQSLFHCALSKTLFWGILVHLCLINLFESVYKEVSAIFLTEGEEVPPLYQTLEERDLNVLAGCLGVAGLVVCVGIYSIYKLNQLSRLETEPLGDTDDSSDSDAGEQQEQRSIATKRAPTIVTDDTGVELGSASYFND